MVMDTEYPVYFTFTSTFTSGSWWIWFCKHIWCSWTVHLLTDIYPMVFVDILQLLYTNCIYWRPYVIHHAKIVLDRRLVWIVDIHTIYLLLYHICFAVGTQKVQYISSSQKNTYQSFMPDMAHFKPSLVTRPTTTKWTNFCSNQGDMVWMWSLATSLFLSSTKCRPAMHITKLSLYSYRCSVLRLPSAFRLIAWYVVFVESGP